ncbi:MAG: polysaccharide pyruvyl transferase family protein [Acidobacteria bacterium]|nr:polysaccharide pyruvyl transferase family protein [Acidobacteriota bacterium]
MKQNPTFVVLGALPDTGNLGVSALHHSIVAGLGRRFPDAHIVSAGSGFGTHQTTTLVDQKPFGYTVTGVRVSKRYWRPESIQTTRALRRVGIKTPFARFVANADGVFDINGGDSFADLYGPHRFREVTLPRQLAYDMGRPTVLLPQTYGPFRDPEILATARRHVRDAAAAWARDEDSFAALRELVGDDFDPQRHRQGVDVAFALEPRPIELDESLQQVLDDGAVGVNVSGLIYNDPEAARTYGLSIDYRAAVESLVAQIAADGQRVILIPHVHAPGSIESDHAACAEVAGRVGDDAVLVAPDFDHPGSAKWFIAQLQWFCGTRMHATIAALSSGVPCGSIAYSLKTRGVFASVGQADHVADARTLDTVEAVEIAMSSYQRRAETVGSLAESVPAVVIEARNELVEIAESVLR